MDIHLAYSMLLGRPWIHYVRVVPSILHERQKYTANGTSMSVRADESLLISKIVTVPYNKSKEVVEIPLHFFEIVHFKLVPENFLVLKLSYSSVIKMMAKTMLK